MKTSKAFTTVTPLSKLIAFILFIGLPFLGFYLGIEFQKGITPAYPPLYYDSSVLAKPSVVSPSRVFNPNSGTTNGMPNASNQQKTICTQDVKQCPDGTWVGRTGEKCTFSCN